MRVLPYGQRQERSGLDPVLSPVGHRNARHKVTTQDYEGSSYRHSRNIGDGRISKVGCVAVRKQGLTMAATTESLSTSSLLKSLIIMLHAAVASKCMPGMFRILGPIFSPTSSMQASGPFLFAHGTTFSHSASGQNRSQPFRSF